MELAPQPAPAGLRVVDPFDEPLDEGGFGVQQGEPVFLLDQEQRVHAPGQRAVDQLADLGALLGEPAKPPAQQLDHLARWQRRDQRQRGHEVRVLVLRLLDQLAQPVAQLIAAGVGERVHGAFRALARAGGFLLDDEAGLGQLPYHHVQRAVVELDAAIVAALAQQPAQLVGVLRPRRQVRQHRQRQQVVHLPSARHAASSSIERLSRINYTG